MKLNFKELIKTKDYDFLRENEDIKNLMLLTVAGSYGAGLNTENSDVDIRGVAYNTKKNLLGLDDFQQFIDKNTDTEIYSFSKIVTLLLKNNPNILELFGNRNENYIYLSEHGQLLKDNINLFLSQAAIKSFSGYAIAQVRRLQNALSRNSFSEMSKMENIKKILQNNIIHFKQTYTDFNSNSIQFSVNNDCELLTNVDLKNYPVKDLVSIWSEMNSIIKSFEKVGHRNNKKDAIHLNKHTCCIFRLFYIGIDLLEGKGIVSFREKENPLLMDIRNGRFLKEDGSYSNECFDLINELEKRFEYAKKNTILPEKPDMKKIEELVMKINLDSIINFN